MSGTTLYVVQHQGTWRIRHGARVSPPHDSRAAALRKAMAFAKWIGSDGRIMVEGSDGRLVPAETVRPGGGAGGDPAAC